MNKIEFEKTKINAKNAKIIYAKELKELINEDGLKRIKLNKYVIYSEKTKLWHEIIIHDVYNNIKTTILYTRNQISIQVESSNVFVFEVDYICDEYNILLNFYDKEVFIADYVFIK
jgi:dephospho-CoA kinase